MNNMANISILPAEQDRTRGPVHEAVASPASTDGVIEGFLSYLQGRGRSEDTRKTYRKAIRRFFSWLGSKGISSGPIFPETMVEYRESLRDLSPSSANLNVVAVRRFFRWAESKQIYPDVAKDLDRFGAEGGFKKMPLTLEEQQRLLDWIGREDYHPCELVRLRDYAMVNLFLLGGLRSVEVSRARVCDIKVKYGQNVLMVWGKGHDYPDAPVVLTDDAYTPIRRYLDARLATDPEEPLFRCEGRNCIGRPLSPRRIQTIVKDALRAIGLDSHEYSTHSLRHSTGTTLLEMGASLSEVQHVLRHRDEKTTHIYVDMKYEEMMIRNAPQHLLDNVLKHK